MLPFSKYSGCGNDFIAIDNRSLFFDPALVPRLCHRHLGIGADGVLLVEPSQVADFKMRIFNSDGSEAEMCGNGLRCFARFLNELNIPGAEFQIEVFGKIYSVELFGDEVKVKMLPPTSCEWGLKVDEFTLDYLDTGVPHAVIFVNDLKSLNLEELGPRLRHHSRFAPRGANVNLCQITKKGLSVRTYERGVEKETLACGTGAAACAFAARKHHYLTGSIPVLVKSGDLLTFTSNEMLGPAHFIFSGSIPQDVLPKVSLCAHGR